MLKIDLDASEISQRLQDVADKYLDLSPLLAEIGEYLLLSTRERFDRQEDPQGQPWQPLSPTYAARKAAHPTALRGILTFSGLLRDTISYRVGPDYVEVGSGVRYAPIHQRGGGRIPARPYLGLSNQDRQEILAILESKL